MASQAIVAMRVCAPPGLAPYMGARWRKAPNSPQFSSAFVVPMRPKRVTLSFRRNCRRPVSAIFRAQRAGETRACSVVDGADGEGGGRHGEGRGARVERNGEGGGCDAGEPQQ
ncbi:hypothetical protein CLOM_g24384, partial [Closterium sp. NIES-68]